MAKGEPGEGTTKRRRMRGVSLATRLAGATVIVSFAALGAATVVGINSGLNLGREIYEDRLVSLNNSGESGMAAAINSAASASDALALSPSTAAAVEAFDDATIELRAPDDFDVIAERRRLVDDYSDIYADVFELAPDELSAQSLAPRAPEAVYLQTQYSIVPDVERVAVVDDAEDGSTWSAVHADVHPGFRRVVDELQLTDLYLIEPVDERIVYSVEKGIDLGTSLRSGPFSGSVLANTVSAGVRGPRRRLGDQRSGVLRSRSRHTRRRLREPGLRQRRSGGRARTPVRRPGTHPGRHERPGLGRRRLR